MRKIITAMVTSFGLSALMPLMAFAHVVVTPSQANVGERVKFSISVPNEREVAVTSLKLDIPKGVTDVQPNVMAGWAIETIKSSDNVASITWSGTIPTGQRADFEFKVQVPAQTGELDWKAYQTYADGTVVSWNEKPTTTATDNEASTSGPYSITQVKNDLAQTSDSSDAASNQNVWPLILSIAAVIIAIFSLFIRRRK